MKTIKKIQIEIKDLTFDIQNANGNTPAEKRKISKMKAELEYLNQILLYLKTEPTKQAVEYQLDKAMQAINRIVESFEDYYAECDSLELKKVLKKDWYKTHNMGVLKNQVRTLKIILD